VAAWLVAVPPAAAHSELVSSIPAAGATVDPSPRAPIVLSFSEALATGSKADIVGPDGATAGTAAIDPSDNTKLSWTPTAPLASGSWTIRWTSVATDGDVLRGTIPFGVAAASAAPTAAPSATPGASPAPVDASTPGAGAVVPVIAALVVIAVLGLVLLRGRRTTARR
jgi:methionine-rich copper-binding protein CopC